MSYFSSPVSLDKPSSFPIFLATFVFFALSGFVFYASSGVISLFLVGLFGAVVCFSCWVYCLTSEFLVGKCPSYIKSAFRFGFGLFIVSEVMFFVSFFWGFFCFSVIATSDVGNEWPPVGINPIPPFGIPLLNTVILLSSGLSVTWAHASVKLEMPSILPLLITIGLGLYFLSIQLVEYGEASFAISDGVYGTSFFMLTGLHGMHVFVGCVMLIAAALRFGSFTALSHVGFECAIWYWHFVDVVWLFLFGFVYVWSTGL